MKFWLRLAVLSSCVAGCWAQTPAAKAPEPVSNSALDGKMLYQLLLGELNVRLGSPGAGFSLLLDAARKTHDPALFQRAVDVALQSRSAEAALQAAQTWKRELPGDREPQRYLLQILLALNRVEEAGQALAESLQSMDENEQKAAIVSIPGVFARVKDKTLAAQVVEKALAASLRRPSLQANAWTSIGRMQRDAQLTDLAIRSAQRGHAADREAVGPIVLAMSLLNHGSPAVRELLDDAMQTQVPPDLALTYVRHLIGSQDLPGALSLLKRLTQHHPDHPQFWLMLGLVQQELGDAMSAQASLRRHVALAAPRTDEESQTGLTESLLALATMAQQQGQSTQADAWLQQLPSRADPVRVALVRAQLLENRGQSAAARLVLEKATVQTPEQEKRRRLALSRWLREHQQTPQALELLQHALTEDSQDPELLLEQSMNLEKLGQLDAMEALLRQVIALRPQEAQAYNALGYALADRNLRLTEARALLVKAVELSPSDPFIQDSLGWVEFRLGHLDDALRILRAAFTAKPDAEIAAHLGEVLWVRGQHEEARAIWEHGRRIKPDNETLVQTLERLGIQP